MTDVVQAGQRVQGSVLCFDTRNGEARLSLRALQPDPFQAFADTAHPGQTLRGTVTKLVAIGAFIRVADDVEGLLPSDDISAGQPVQVNDPIEVTVIEVDRDRRRLCLSRRPT